MISTRLRKKEIPTGQNRLKPLMLVLSSSRSLNIILPLCHDTASSWWHSSSFVVLDRPIHMLVKKKKEKRYTSPNDMLFRPIACTPFNESVVMRHPAGGVLASFSVVDIYVSKTCLRAPVCPALVLVLVAVGAHHGSRSLHVAKL